MSTSKITCRVCKSGTLHESVSYQEFFPNKKKVTVELLESKCDTCGSVRVLSAQHEENLRRLAARKSEYDGQLMGEEYIAFRKRYGLTQQQASKILGKGIIAFSRYENEEFYPDTSSRLLFEVAMARPEVLKMLADKAGVTIPLWKERCEDEQRIKVRPFLAVSVDAPTIVRQQWTLGTAMVGGRAPLASPKALAPRVISTEVEAFQSRRVDFGCEVAA
ncbi:MAG: type II TA system antitoxin MqsA family protein [Telluria sp.]